MKKIIQLAAINAIRRRGLSDIIYMYESGCSMNMFLLVLISILWRKRTTTTKKRSRTKKKKKKMDEADGTGGDYNTNLSKIRYIFMLIQYK